MKIQGFGTFSLLFYQKDDFLIFFYDSLMVFEGERDRRKSSKNYQKIIILLEKNQEILPKTMKIQGFGKFFFLSSSKIMFF